MKRLLFKVVLFLILGATTSIAVAWGCVASNPIRLAPSAFPRDHWHMPRYIDAAGIWKVVVERGVGTMVVISKPIWVHKGSETRLYVHDTEPDSVGSLTIRTGKRFWHFQGNYPYTFKEDIDDRLVPTWSYPQRTLAQADDWENARFFVDQAWGWPMLIMQREARLVDWKALPPSRRPQGPIAKTDEPKIILPDRIIWAGFAINTSIYTATFWLLALGSITARRITRRKRGRCVRCGYDLSHVEHEACPECGADGSL